MVNTIRKTLELFLQDGFITEIRALKCWDRNPEFTCNRSGYFNDLDAAVLEVEALERKWHPAGIYLTINPVKPDLLSRAVNRMKKGEKNQATSHTDIAKRSWMYLDFDPCRPAGVSSNELELWSAGEIAKLCGKWLFDNGFGNPIVAMSGNGYHLLYRIDLPADDNGLIKACLDAVSEKFTTPDVHVDPKVFDQSRITKLYGTLACKGDHTEDRPHRRSEILEIPSDLNPIPEERLAWLASQAKCSQPVPSERKPTASYNDDARIRVEHWLSRYGVRIINRDKSPDGADRWFIPCPGIESHTSANADTDCCITQEPSGAMGGHCFHSSCGMTDWHALKNVIGPLEWEDYHESEAQVATPGVDEFIAAKFKTESEPVTFSEKLPDFPQELLSCGGIIERIVDYNMRTAIYPMPELALAGALAMMSLITGRKVEDRWELRTNAYFLGLADAGSGKNHSRQVNNKILASLNKTDMMGPSKLKSSSGLISTLEQQPACLFQIDEMSRLLQTMRDPRNAPHLYDIGTVMLEAYSESANPAWKAGAYADRKKNPIVSYPHLVVYGVAVSSEFWQSLTKSNLTDGLLGRLMPFENRERISSRDPVKSPPDEIMLAEIASWINYETSKGLIQSINPPEFTRVNHSPAAWERYQEHFKAIEKSRPGESDTAYSIWKRTGEKTGKLAMMCACSRVPPISGNWPTIELPDVEWAIRLSNWLTRSVLNKAGLYVAETPHEQNLIRLLRGLEDWKSKTDIALAMRSLKARDREELLRGALADGFVVERKVGGTTKPITEYRRTARIKL